VLATDSAKACYYAYSKNDFKTVFKPFDQVVSEAVNQGGEYNAREPGHLHPSSRDDRFDK
ncbi:MAG: hypothetical protein WBD56_15845, partial [Anaerolineales bacterium]